MAEPRKRKSASTPSVPLDAQDRQDAVAEPAEKKVVMAENKENPVAKDMWPPLLENKEDASQGVPKGRILPMTDDQVFEYDGYVKDNQFWLNEDHYVCIRQMGSRRPVYKLLASKNVPLPVSMAPKKDQKES